jgi:hypothetical protein
MTGYLGVMDEWPTTHSVASQSSKLFVDAADSKVMKPASRIQERVRIALMGERPGLYAVFT